MLNEHIVTYRRRAVYLEDLPAIRDSIREHYKKGRTAISRELCAAWNWKQPNGRLKDYACRLLLLKLQELGHVELPPAKKPGNNLQRGQKVIRTFEIDESPLKGLITDFQHIEVKQVTRPEWDLWKYLVDKYHYLGYKNIVGENLRYLCFVNGKIVACMGWGSAAMKSGPREQFIGWDENVKANNLHYVINNTRFLILPWVNIPHLASKLLSLNCKRLSSDWKKFYNHPVYLTETFVDISRFQGTCYKAANWKLLGHTKGHEKKGDHYFKHGQVKALFVYPLHKKYKELLLGLN